MCNKRYRVSDSELLYLIAQGNLEAKVMLDDRYKLYCKGVTKDFLDKHNSYGLTYEDYFDAAILGYCKARNKFSYEVSTAFYPYFRKWAESEMKALIDEGNRFYMNGNPKRFISLDITYKSEDDPLSLAERCGEHDAEINKGIEENEILELLGSGRYGLTRTELQICIGYALGHTEREIREALGINYARLDNSLRSIKRKIGRKLSNIVK